MESARRPWPSFFCKFLALMIFCRGCFSVDCPADGRMWVPFGKSCYHFVHGDEDILKSYTIEKAKDICHGYGLLTINSEEENRFVVDYSSKVWKESMDVWLGMYFDPDNNTLMWQNQMPLLFTNWGTYSEAQVPGDTCAALHASTGKWEMVSCQESAENGVVCKTLQEPENKKKNSNSRLLSALVVLSVVVILGISAVIWFLQQKYNFGPTLFTAFEYHPPFRSPRSDEAGLIEVEETEPMP